MIKAAFETAKQAGEAAASITDWQIRQLRTEAAVAGDDKQVKLCTLALAGSKKARQACAEAIGAARAMGDA